MRHRSLRHLLLWSTPAALLVVASPHDAHGQAAGTVSRPLPNVLLLVDSSGSMEKMPDGSLPSENRDPVTGAPIGSGTPNTCVPGVESNPNRMGILVQALTGNMQPYYSCAAMPRAAGSLFTHEFKIGGVTPYDTDYALPYHRPLSGGAGAACALSPNALPGATIGAGVGPTGRAATGTNPEDFPSSAFTTYPWSNLIGITSTADPSGAGTCTFDQANDGQLDLSRDYVRFSMMTFDGDPRPAQGVSALTAGTILADPFAGLWSYWAGGATPTARTGVLPGCASVPYEVGARHWAAPPWEGRHVPFPSPTGSQLDVQQGNSRVQQALSSLRPYGATPIDGLLTDARDYLWFNPRGPEGSLSGFADEYVKGGCRDQFVILLTDGAPNLDMRPACTATGGTCPFPQRGWEVVRDLYDGTGGPHRVQTFVIGFAVSGSGVVTGDGFPSPFNTYPQNNCKAWFNASGATTAGLAAACAAANPTPGTTASACCVLNQIADAGSGGKTPAFFAESQADLVLAFGRILGSIAKDATTRTVPAYSPTIAVSGTSVSANFLSSFNPNPRAPWSGTVERERATCSTGTLKSEIREVAKGDYYDQNLAAQSVGKTRRFITVVGNAVSSVVDSSVTMRPFTAATAETDGIPDSTGAEISLTSTDFSALASKIPVSALDIDANTCKRSKDITGAVIPALDAASCAQVTWGFATAHPDTISFGGYSKFNVRCANATAGSSCALTGATCTTGADCSAGDTCVPNCSALGAVFRSSPTVVGAPSALSRDDGYRTFATGLRTRMPTMFVATIDGILHAFKALETKAPSEGRYEQFAFIPPAVLPRLKSNYPAGQQVLLDGPPVVRDVVWERQRNEIVRADKWHSVLVAGLGGDGGGYYALNVSDLLKTDDSIADIYEAPTTNGDLAQVSAPVTGAKRGAHFLWQLIDMPKKLVGELAKPTRRTKTGTDMVALFGKQTGTPAITTLYFDPAATGSSPPSSPREIGVAILPGGVDGAPESGDCDRALGSTGYPTSTFVDMSDALYPRRSKVRKWGATCTAPVAGRGITIVRLDTGEIVRHFGRRNQDAPQRLVDAGVVVDSPFDSPVVGTPVVYPNDVGTVAQRAFVGDADGTVWRIDLRDANPNNWRVNLFHDTQSATVSGSAATSQPVAVPPVMSLDSAGNLVLQVATGDQEQLGPTAYSHFVYSIVEKRPTTTLAAQAEVRWRFAMTGGERVTGPMATFDGVTYFATFKPAPTTNACATGRAYLYGMDYILPKDGDPTLGGLPRWCPIGSTCPTVPYVQGEDISTSTQGAFIPGVSIRATPACADLDAAAYTDYFGSMHRAATSMTSTQYSLFAGVARSNTSSGGASVATVNAALPMPRTATVIDAWASIVE